MKKQNEGNNNNDGATFLMPPSHRMFINVSKFVAVASNLKNSGIKPFSMIAEF